MKKFQLDQFLAKYTIGGAIESAEWTADSSGVRTAVATDDTHALAFVHAVNLQLPDGVYRIAQTGQLRSLLSVLGDDITMEVQKHQGKDRALLFKDGPVKVTAMLADPKLTIRKPRLLNLPTTPDIDAILTPAFITQFNKAKGALGAEVCAISTDGPEIQIVQMDAGGNTVRLTPPTATVTGPVKNVRFSVNHIAAIFGANKEMNEAHLSVFVVDGKALMRIEYAAVDYTATYYVSQDTRH